MLVKSLKRRGFYMEAAMKSGGGNMEDFTIQIRQAVLEDLEAVSQVEASSFPPAEAAGRETLRQRLEQFQESFLVAVDQRVIGIVNGCVTDQETITDDLFDRPCAHQPTGAYQAVFGLAVLEEYRGRGVAAALLREFCARARKSGRRGVILTCKERLIPYYTTLGFQKLGVSASVHGGAVWYDMICRF